MSRSSLTWALVVAGALVALEEAEARVGGGQSFSSGRSSSSGGGGGGGGIDGDLVVLLIRLIVYYPEVGVPLTLAVVGWAWWTHRANHHDRAHMVIEARGAGVGRRRVAADTGWEALAARDPGLSRPVLYDVTQLVIRRAWAASSTADREALAPFVAPSVWRTVDAARAGLTAIDEVVIASQSVQGVVVQPEATVLRLLVTMSRLERRGEQAERAYVEEVWAFRRAAGARSLPPEDARRLGCPSCGAAVQCDRMGRCTSCGTPITEGQLQWQAVTVDTITRRRITAPEVGLLAGDEEPSYREPTIAHPDLPARLRAFIGRHPELDQQALGARVAHVFHALQTAWDAGRWQDARPYVTDAAWNTLRFWLDRYREGGLANRLADVHLERQQICDVELDAWYESLTVRIWASMRDWTEETATGRVVGGNARTPRKFSEYWTFIRAVGSGDRSGDPTRCPSCGAPLDHVSAAGVCGYCDSVITTGRFDWVLSRIDQAEVYRVS